MKYLETFTKKWWHLLAVIIVAWAAGPEIFIYAEGMVIMEALGAATFVFMYVVGAKLYLRNIWSWFFEFENKYHFFLPSWKFAKQSPGLLYYSIPRRSIFYLAFLLLTVLLLFGFKSV